MHSDYLKAYSSKKEKKNTTQACLNVSESKAFKKYLNDSLRHFSVSKSFEQTQQN